MKKISIYLSFCLLFAVYTLLILPGCEKKEVKSVRERVINVRVQPVKKKSLRPFINTTGTLNPYEEIIISSEIDGILKEVKAEEGVAVSKGMLVAVIDDTDYNLEVERTYATLKEAEINLSNIKLEYSRKEDLYKKEFITRQQFDDISAKLSLAEAEVERTRSSLSIAKQRLSKTKVFSPISGIVRVKKASAGDYIRNGTPLFEIIEINPIKLNFTVTEKEVGKIKIGQNVLFTVYAFPDREFKGTLNIIYPSLDEKTRTLQVEALAPNPDRFLKPGFFAKVMLYTGAPKDIILVPVTSLLYEGEKTRVFIVEGNGAKERFIKAGQKYQSQIEAGSQESEADELIEVIEGVEEGNEVVITGQQNLFEGAKVTIQPGDKK